MTQPESQTNEDVVKATNEYVRGLNRAGEDLEKLKDRLELFEKQRDLAEEQLRQARGERDSTKLALDQVRQASDKLRAELGARLEGLGRERDRWRARAEKAEAVPRNDELARILEDRDHLRAEVGGLSRKISELAKDLEMERQFAREMTVKYSRAQERANGMESTLYAMQNARDEAQRQRDGAIARSVVLQKDLDQARAAGKTAVELLAKLENVVRSYLMMVGPSRGGGTVGTEEGIKKTQEELLELLGVGRKG